MGSYLDVVRKYAVFEGRARRKEFWMFTLVNVLMTLGFTIADVFLGTFDEELEIGLLSGLYLLVLFLPTLAVTVRRLHDRDRSGWYVLLGFVPILGTIPLLVFLCQDSTPGTNRYGTNPKGIIA